MLPEEPAANSWYFHELASARFGFDWEKRALTLALARVHPDRLDRGDVSLVITGGLRKLADFIKAMALGRMRLPC